VHSGHESSTHYFSCTGWDQYGFDKKRVGTRYAEHVFFASVGSAGHVVHSGASRA
jgi:hypothetical protein